MLWTSAVSDAPSFSEAVEQVCEQVSARFDGKAPDLALAFVTSHHGPSFYVAADLFREKLGPVAFIGCSALGVIGAGSEIERRPGVSLLAARLPGAVATPLYFKQDDLPDADAPPEAWHRLIGAEPDRLRAVLLLPDPFTVRTDMLLAGLDFAFPDAVKIGGLVSGGTAPGSNALFVEGNVRRSGIAGFAFTGDISVETTVAQGCRPVGRPMVVTESQENLIVRLDGEPPLEIVQELFSKARRADQRLIRRSLQVGVLHEPLTDDAEEEFLIRNILGADQADGSLAIGEAVREGQVIQFHVHDADAATEELRTRLMDSVAGHDSFPSAALMFSSVGRGQYLFGASGHDTALFGDEFGDTPLAGFFSNGEISTSNGRSLLHGYTSTFAMFREREPARVVGDRRRADRAVD